MRRLTELQTPSSLHNNHVARADREAHADCRTHTEGQTCADRRTHADHRTHANHQPYARHEAHGDKLRQLVHENLSDDRANDRIEFSENRMNSKEEVMNTRQILSAKIALLGALLIATLSTSDVRAATMLPKDSKEVKVQPFQEEPSIELPREAYEAIKKWNKNFELFNLADYTPTIRKLFREREKNEVPMIVHDDLNGDGKKDIALLGADKKKQYAIVLLGSNVSATATSAKHKWKVKVIETWNFENITKSEVPGETTPEFGIPFYILPSQSEQPGLQVETYLAPPKVYKL